MTQDEHFKIMSEFMKKKKLSRNYDGIFLFRFTNGLYFCKQEEIKEGTDYYIDDFCRNKRADFNDVVKKYMFIKWQCLKPISELIL